MAKYRYNVAVWIPLSTSTGKLKWEGIVEVGQPVDSSDGVSKLQEAATAPALDWARQEHPRHTPCGHVELGSWQLAD